MVQMALKVIATPVSVADHYPWSVELLLTQKYHYYFALFARRQLERVRAFCDKII